MTEKSLYRYRATVTAVYDGDTLTVDVDLGFHTSLRDCKVRLLGIDAPEIKGGDALSKGKARAARDWLASQCLGREVYLESTSLDKYGRSLGRVYTLDGTCLNDELLRLGLVGVYED